uniref:Uncharacterized protein n=1 Tax=Anopheles atroparvus TaxID=41427 RepID=A0A182J8S7_ANOAO
MVISIAAKRALSAALSRSCLIRRFRNRRVSLSFVSATVAWIFSISASASLSPFSSVGFFAFSLRASRFVVGASLSSSMVASCRFFRNCATLGSPSVPDATLVDFFVFFFALRGLLRRGFLCRMAFGVAGFIFAIERGTQRLQLRHFLQSSSILYRRVSYTL